MQLYHFRALRLWYKLEESLFKGRLDYSGSLENTARQACEMRNRAREYARLIMKDTVWSDALVEHEVNRTFEQFVVDKVKDGLSGDDLWNAIIESSARARSSVDELFGLK